MQIPSQDLFAFTANSNEEINQIIAEALTNSIAMSGNNNALPLRPHSPINSLSPPPTQPNRVIQAQSQVGSMSGRGSQFPRNGDVSNVASRSNSYKPSNKIRMQSARKVSPALVY